jgi:hypothetical protein
VLLANDILLASEICCSAASRGPGSRCSVLVLQFVLGLPRGSSAGCGAGPSWVGGTRGMPSGEIGGGGDGPAAGALIGLTGCELQSRLGWPVGGAWRLGGWRRHWRLGNGQAASSTQHSALLLCHTAMTRSCFFFVAFAWRMAHGLMASRVRAIEVAGDST